MFFDEVDEKAVDVNVEDDKEETVKEDVNEDKGAKEVRGVELNAHGAQVRHDSAEPRSSNQA